MGPTNFSVLQQTQRSYTTAQVIGETNLMFQGLYASFAPGFAGGGRSAPLNTARKLFGSSEPGETGGLNLFKFNSPQAENPTGWRSGDYFLRISDQGSPQLNWKQNYGALRSEMKLSRPIFDSYRTPQGNLIPAGKGSFLNAERGVLADRGWVYNFVKGAWMPPL